MEIVNLWVVRRAGQHARHYTKKKPAAGEDREFLPVLLDSIGREEDVLFNGKRTVSRAPQSVFAEQAAKLWQSTQRTDWIQDVADTHDSLLEMGDMDPLLKLDLVRRFLSLAVRTSAGYEETLGEMPEFKQLTGRAGLITGNWLDPGEDLEKERDQATALLKTAPQLLRICALATTRDEQRLLAIKHGLVAIGWICRDGDDSPTLVKFGGASLAGPSRLYTVGGGEWIDLGLVSDDRTTIRFNTTAGGYVGWPVFALLSSR